MKTATHNRKEGSALIAVLALGVVLSMLVAEFGHMLRGDLKAAGTYYDEARTYQLARSGMALAQMELKRKQAYVDNYGNLFFLRNATDMEETIEELKIYRTGCPLGRGRAAYAFIHKATGLNLTKLTSPQWHRLLEMACEIDEGDERSALVDCAIDWIDRDNIQRPLGAEAEAYEEMEPPRYIRNGTPESIDELLRVNGFTREILYGEGIPLREESGMLFGGGIYRYIIGDNSPEGRASRKYIMTGVPTEEILEETLDEDEIEYTRLKEPPEELYLIARGFIPHADTEVDAAAEHMILAKLKYVKKKYSVVEWHDHADRKTVERLTAYGLESTDVFLTEGTDYDS
ncbi:hypothetical protein ACFLQY_05495 [Verrucomicrobiota bacterium]